MVEEIEAIREAENKPDFDWLTPETGQKATQMLEILQEKFPKQLVEELLLSSISVAVQNAKSNFFTYTLPDFLKNPALAQNPQN